MGTWGEIQEVINSRLFSQKKKTILRHGDGGNLWNPSEKLLMRHEPFIMSADSVGTLLSFVLLLPLSCVSFFTPAAFLCDGFKAGFICETHPGVNLLWPGGAATLEPWVQHEGFSGFAHSAFQSMTTAIVRGRRDLATWSGHGKNGTASTFHTSLGVTANFLYCTFDWKHIWNIFLWSHFSVYNRKKKGEDGEKKKAAKAARTTAKLWANFGPDKHLSNKNLYFSK